MKVTHLEFALFVIAVEIHKFYQRRPSIKTQKRQNGGEGREKSVDLSFVL